MERALVVGVGGFIGTVLRYGLGGLILRLKDGAAFPLETFLVNVTGCFMIGVLDGLSEARGVFSGTTRAFLFIGVLGGYTTFSSFGYETVQLLREGQAATAAWSVGLQVVLGIGAVWMGFAGARIAWGS